MFSNRKVTTPLSPWRGAGCEASYANCPEPTHFLVKQLRGDKGLLLLHVAQNLPPLYLSGSLKPFVQRLRRETLIVDMRHGVTDKIEIACHYHRIIGQEIKERYLLSIHQCQIGNNLYCLLAFLRQLILHIESTDTVDVVAKEVDTIGQFA